MCLNRNIVFIFLLSLFAASCGDTGRTADGEFVNPLDEWVIPSQVRAGGEGIVQWNGFKEDAGLALDSEVRGEVPLTITSRTASGVTFAVPAYATAGEYMLILLQDGRKEMGKVEVLAMEMPISGLKVPSSAVQGETVQISGIGFKPGCTVLLSSASGNEVEMTPAHIYGGIEIVVPEDLPEGKYQMSLVQDEMRWMIAQTFDVYADIVIKQLSELRYYSPYIGNQLLMVSWRIERGDVQTLTHSENIVSGDQIEVDSQDIYESTDEYSFEITYDGYEASDNYEFTYNYADGLLVNADVVRFNGKTTQYVWQYNSEGYVTEIVLPNLSIYMITYDSGNIVAFDQIRFAYENPVLVNAPCAPDVIWAYKAINEWAKPVAVFPYLLGWYDKSSSLLPSTMYLPDVSSADGGEIECLLTYEFDEDGYVTKMSWSVGKDKYWIEYQY